jgi:hypothetical protein
MRPAPRSEFPPEEPADVEARAEASLPPGQKRGLVIGLLVAAMALAGIGVGVWAVLTGGGPSPSTGGQGGPAPLLPLRPPFVFRIDRVHVDSTGRRGTGAAQDAAVEMAGNLSSFYDAVFMDPATWKGGVPDEAWALFDASIRDRARKDAAAFTLGAQAVALRGLEVEDTSLYLTVLVDPRGSPQTAVATVKFEATGMFDGGQQATVTNKASFLFHIRDGQWVVFGYPIASTSIAPVANSPSPGQSSSSPSPSATP